MKKFNEVFPYSFVTNEIALDYGGSAGYWAVGLFSEATHGGCRLSGAPHTKKFSKTRGRNGKPSGECTRAMFEWARHLDAMQIRQSPSIPNLHI